MRLNEIYEEFGDEVEFFCVYIQEAHPTDGRQAVRNVTDGILFAQPKTGEEREAVAQVCMLRLNLKMPMLLDHMTNEVDRLYAALPDRLYLIDPDGAVVYRSAVGSPGFDVEEWREAIERHVAACREQRQPG